MTYQHVRVAACAWACALVFQSTGAAAQTQVKPWFFVIVDTSGSMADTDVGSNSCSYPSNRMGAARCAIRNILDSTGDAEFGLLQFAHRCTSDCADTYTGSSSGECTADTQNLEVVNPDGSVVREWVDGVCEPLPMGDTCSTSTSTLDLTSVGNQRELYAVGYTPIASTLQAAKQYFEDAIGSKPSPTKTDAYAGCRPINVILLTDGDESCGGAPATAAGALRSTTIPLSSGSTTIDVKTYVIGFGSGVDVNEIEGIATAGGTDAPGANRGFYVSDEAQLSAALNQIIVDSQVNESCDGIDNDCDTRVDEGNPKYCDVNQLRATNPMVSDPTTGALVDQGTLDPRLAVCNMSPCPAVDGTQGQSLCAQPEWSSSTDLACSPVNILCESPGELCNLEDDDCDGSVDESAPELSADNEVCNDTADNDCDGLTDEGCVGCSPETCDGVDNDCDGETDEITRPCGLNVGLCTTGVEQCIGADTWGPCSGDPPTLEVCDGDDNDCDGVVDGNTQPCGSQVGECREGTETCAAGTFGSCVGQITPGLELCDGLDNDCDDDPADDGDDDARIGQACGSNQGVCMQGTWACVGGGLSCQNETTGGDELCDGLDNDCDGNVDEGVSVTDPAIDLGCILNGLNVVTGAGASVQGECQQGTTACYQGGVVCNGYGGPSPEQCDNLDHDCDGDTTNGVATTDTRIGDSCGSIVGVCAPGGVLECINEAPTCNAAVLPGQLTETCDGSDEDCDGKIDEGDPGGGGSCDSDGHMARGLCELGTEACVGGALVCQNEVRPNQEICDGEDNDCDGKTDEGVLPQVGLNCGTDTGECEYGAYECNAGVLECVGGTIATDELCDGLDNDCDGEVDDSPVDIGQRCDCTNDGSCGAEAAPTSCRRSADPSDSGLALDDDLLCGECKKGTMVCEGGVPNCAGYVGPIDELCNGRDDDCDDPCLRLDTDSDGILDTFNCPATCGVDDPDCLSQVDEGVDATDPNLGILCGDNDTGECEKGTQVCQGGDYVCQGEVKPSVEVCDGKDNDCDSLSDDGIPVGDPCGQTEVGECSLGFNVCDDQLGELVCEGDVGPATELCDGLDNDCNSLIDDGIVLGGECGSSEGECSPGRRTCTDGREVCVGEDPPQPEVCDCLDNDCDGLTDEVDGDGAGLCGGQAACVMCQCAAPCADGGEFGTQCPAGKAAIEDGDGTCRCVGKLCDANECGEQTITNGATGEISCAPESATVGACVCVNNACTFRCAGKECNDGLLCDSLDGRCKVQSCLLPQFACADAERCDPTVMDCVEDECADADCDGPCRRGECFESCNLDEPCPDGQVCHSGACEEDKCASLTCSRGATCDPATGVCELAGECLATGCADGFVCDALGGQCEPDPCLATSCPLGEVCELGECVALCEGDMVPCNGVCIDPQLSREYCGARDLCQGDDAGQRCPDGQVCSLGECGDTCADDLINCGGMCIDPATDESFCGAQDSCEGAAAGHACLPDQDCVEGTCRQVMMTTAPTVQIDQQASQTRSHTLVLGTGGAACGCSVPGQGDRAPTMGAWAVALGLISLVVARMRRRRCLVTALRGLASLVTLALLLLLGGCTIDPFCVDCAQSDDDPGVVGSDSDRFQNADNTPDGPATGGGADGGESGGDGDGAGDDGRLPDGGIAPANGDGGAGNAPQCSDREICNGLDDDCDDSVDEDVDPAAEGIDVATNVNHCGACANACSLVGAFAKCEQGACVVDACDVNRVDLDGEPDNGCEIQCAKQADDDSDCNFRDDDCDGTLDEDVDLTKDAENCGSCGYRCGFPHAAAGGACEDSACVLDTSKCDDGYHDINGIDGDGCEHRCTPAADNKERCNRKDDDCDGVTDEDVATDDPAIGVSCGTDEGECVAGVTVCGVGDDAGRVLCSGEVIKTTEVCDGVDNNCDGNIDEEDSEIGQACGNSVGECRAGSWTCNTAAGRLDCVGGQAGLPDEICNGLDDDCDGRFDENPLNEGVPCATLTGSLVLSPGALPGTCVAGVAACQLGGLVCVGETGPAPELCDGLDNDCDGDASDDGVDEPNLAAACGSNQGECSPGSWACDSGMPGLVCQGGDTGSAELCNGKDDDCDGDYDEGGAVADPNVGIACILDGAGGVVTGPGATVQGQCSVGNTVCSGGSIACPDYVGPTAELCDSLDHDCDGSALANLNDPLIGSTCPGNATGECNPGSYICNTTSQARECAGVVGPTAELCDGRDNDCDGLGDDGEDDPQLGEACGSTVGACRVGGRSCVGGNMQCVGQVLPAVEQCDVTAPDDFSNAAFDDDCDGTVDEDFQFDTDVTRCGTCDNACSFPDAIAQCVAGACQIAACQTDYHGADCSIGPCGFNGAEVCDGDDDDCDETVDEGLTPPTCTCGGAPATCGGLSGWECAQEPSSEVCNGSDDDCDGSTDEGFGLNASCSAPGVGACATAGTVQCDPTDVDELATRCEDDLGNEVSVGTGVQELCNGDDDDCDGNTDEACPSTDGNCVTDDWTTLSDGTTEIYRYEAARPDATGDGSGSDESRACSASGRLPWTNVTYAEALAACNAAGARLCDEGEWEQSCMEDDSGSCVWAYPTFGTCDEYTDYVTNQCNGVDYTDGTYATVQPTGESGAASMCYRSRTGDTNNQIFELSGNVKEYTLQRSGGAIPVRGGAHNNLRFGLSCGFDYPVWPSESPFSNVGFRCCRGTAVADICGTISEASLSESDASEITHSLHVPFAGVVTDLRVVQLQGSMNEFRQVASMELLHPDGTAAFLFNQTASNCGSGDDDWDFEIRDGAANSWPPASGQCGNGGQGIGEGLEFTPADALLGGGGAFTGKSAVGDWTLRITNGGGVTDSMTLQEWGLYVCVDPN